MINTRTYGHVTFQVIEDDGLNHYDLSTGDFKWKIEGHKELTENGDLHKKVVWLHCKHDQPQQEKLTLKVSVSPRPCWSETEKTLHTHDVIVSGAVVEKVADPSGLRRWRIRV